MKGFITLFIGLLSGVWAASAFADIIPLDKDEWEKMNNTLSVSYRLYSVSGKEVKVPYTLVLQCFDNNLPGKKKLWEDVVPCSFEAGASHCSRDYHRINDFKYKGVLGGDNICKAQIVMPKYRKTLAIPVFAYGNQFPLGYDRYSGETTVFLRLQRQANLKNPDE